MSKWLITGLNGTLGPHLARAACEFGVEVIGWDRKRIDPDDAAAGKAWLEQQQPDAIAHLGMGSAAWAGRLAAHAAERSLPFVLTSTAMVFHHRPDGPHAPDATRNAIDDYGRYKIDCEDAVLDAHSAASVVRIGWQIDEQPTGNNMLAALDRWQAEQGRIGASRLWRPACSFMSDTAAALAGLLRTPRKGVLHLDSNADEGHAFDVIVAALKQRFARDDWVLFVHQDYRHDQRLAGGCALVPPLSARLPLLEPSADPWSPSL